MTMTAARTLVAVGDRWR